MSDTTRNRSAVALGRELVTVIQERKITFLAASLTYYAFSSLIPLLLLAISIAALVGGRDLQNRIVEAAGGSLPPSVGGIITNTIQSTGAAGASIGVGLIFLIWSAIKIFRGMDIAFSEVYGDSGPEGIVAQVKNALVTLVAVIAAVVVTIVVGAAVSFIETTPILGQIGLGFLQEAVGYLGGIIAIVAVAIALLPLYYFLPGADVSVREVLPGALFGAVGWTILQTGFRIYSSMSGSSAYGIIGAALLILTFLYFGGVILLVGVALNAVLAGRAFDADADEEGEESRDEGETDTGDGVFRRRVKERTQTLVDERERGPAGETDADADGDRGDHDTDSDAGRPVTDGGVEHPTDRDPPNEATESEASATAVESDDTGSSEGTDETGERAGTAETTAAETESVNTETESATGMESTRTPGSVGHSESARPEAALATNAAGTEYTLDEEYALQREIERLRAELDAFEMEVEERVVSRDELEDDLESYVRKRVRSSKARGWGPYLVLLYGTVMTIAIALGNALSGWLAVLAIVIIFLSTLGLYVLMVMVGLGVSALSIPGKARRAIQSRRS